MNQGTGEVLGDNNMINVTGEVLGVSEVLEENNFLKKV